MSDFKFPCPKCGQNILCDTSNAGMQIPCPVCKAVLTVPPPPPPVPAANVPGKLSINKVAHHPPPPPPGAAAGGPPKPAWGTKSAPVAKKGMPKWAKTSIYCAVALIVAGGGWFGWSKYAEQKHQEEVAKQEAEAKEKAEADRQAKEAAAKIKAARAVYSLDLSNTEFPVRAVSGKIHGLDFKADTALFHGNLLTLRQTTGSSAQFVISLPVVGNEGFGNKTFDIVATNLNAPHVVLNWRGEPPKPPGAETFSKGYAMKLEFGPMTDGQISGKIFLCVPDAEQSFVAGDFSTSTNKMAAPTGAPGAAPAGRQRTRKTG